MSYTKRPAPPNYDPSWQNQESANIEASLTAPVAYSTLDPQYKEPPKRWPGMTLLALSPWNPGSGDGVYTYYSGVWNKLG